MARTKTNLKVTPDDKWRLLRRLIPIVWGYGVASNLAGSSEYTLARCLDAVSEAVEKFWEDNADGVKADVVLGPLSDLANIYRELSEDKIDRESLRSLIWTKVLRPINARLAVFDFPPFPASAIDRLTVSANSFRPRGAIKARERALMNLAALVDLKRSRAEEIVSRKSRKFPLIAPVEGRRYNNRADHKLLTRLLFEVFGMNARQVKAVQQALDECQVEE